MKFLNQPKISKGKINIYVQKYSPRPWKLKKKVTNLIKRETLKTKYNKKEQNKEKSNNIFFFNLLIFEDTETQRSSKPLEYRQPDYDS